MQIPLFISKVNHRLLLVTPRLIIKKPQLLVRMLYRDLFQSLYKARPLRSILFHTHYKCNLNCSHCYERNFKKTDKKLLTLTEKKKIISECLDLGVLSFDFVSGESSLDPDLPELVMACRPQKTYITLASNGYDFTEERIKFLLNIGIDKMNISVDSWYPEEHNALRGKEDSYQNAFKTIEMCKKIGMDINLTVFVYKNSTETDGFHKLAEYAIKNRIRLGFKAAVPLGALQGKYETLITEADNDLMFQLHEKYPFLKRTCVGRKDSVCPAFSKLLAITAYGDVLPCNTIHVSFGNLRFDNLKHIINRARKIKYFNGECTGCPPAEDRFFITKYLSKTFDVYPYPAKAEAVFSELQNCCLPE